MNEQQQNKKALKEYIQEATEWIKDIGWPSFKNGEWLLIVVKRSFKAYYLNSNAQYYRRKYPRLDDDAIIKKLILVAAKNAAILGSLTGAAVSIDEIMALVVSLPSGGLNLPAQIGIATTALAAEAVVLVRIQLHLIANIAKLLDVPLDPDDPEDILLILQFAFGGVVAEQAGKVAAKTAGAATRTFVKKQISGKTLALLKKQGAKLGLSILQRSIIKYAVPIVSSLVGGTWNYLTTAKVGGIAAKHFRKSQILRV
jgi:hypothetical protein